MIRHLCSFNPVALCISIPNLTSTMPFASASLCDLQSLKKFSIFIVRNQTLPDGALGKHSLQVRNMIKLFFGDGFCALQLKLLWTQSIDVWLNFFNQHFFYTLFDCIWFQLSRLFCLIFDLLSWRRLRLYIAFAEPTTASATSPLSVHPLPFPLFLFEQVGNESY